MAGQDDGSRETAVRELGEDAVRAAEVEVVKAHADRLSVATFRAMGIPTSSILEGLDLDADHTPDRPALLPPNAAAPGAEERTKLTPGWPAPGPGVAR
ncbi:hypothetical protein K8W59_19470 [Nocardioides rotundus]|uniref:hypothetical protein n=1 Tax=Nocardioides rotundus TaxID=1774216 RepID=UPI001CBF3061|nr:hypothetical protein [Nocardioides rotundus]UAL29871.1 hypothetical protein K8W59_19470 [Nocardioides rotundus]